MYKRSEMAAVFFLCVVFTSIPALLHGWDLWHPEYFPEGAVKGTIRIGESQDWQFVGVDYEKDLWSAGHAAWAVGPSDVIELIHPDPNVNPAIVKWMIQNDVRWAVTYFSKNGYINKFWVTRANGDGTYSTLYYNDAA